MSPPSNGILPEHDFWRACVLGTFVIFLTGIVAILATEVPFVLGIAIVLSFAAWWKSEGDESVETTSVAEEPELDAVEVLRARYANGDIGEDEFEDRLDTLLETEITQSRQKELSFE